MKTPRRNIIRRSTALLVLGALGTLSARADLVGFDSFESYTAGSNIHGQSGGTGWGGAWSVLPIGSSTAGTTAVSSTSITYNHGGATLGGGKSLLLSNTSNGTQRNVFESVNTAGSDYYVSMIFQFSGSVFAGWQALDNDPSINNDSIGLVAQNGSVAARVDDVTSPVNSSSPGNVAGFVSAGTTYFMVIEYTGWTGTNYSTVNVWINPNTGDQSASSVSATYTDPSTGDGGGSAGFLGLYVRTLIDSTPVAESMLIDDLRVGTDWGSVTTIPEPGSASLAAAGAAALFALAGRRRRA
jgi:MYXO-CTERM domain-containing protein